MLTGDVRKVLQLDIGRLKKAEASANMGEIYCTFYCSVYVLESFSVYRLAKLSKRPRIERPWYRSHCVRPV